MHDRLAEASGLSRLAGTWRGHELTSTPVGDVASEGVMSMRPACAGRFLLSDYVQQCGGATVFTGHGVYGWDEVARKVTMHWFDSESRGGIPVPALGAWDGDVLTLVAPGPRHVRYVYELRSPDMLEFRLEWSADGLAWSRLLQGQYARASDAGRPA